VLFKDIQDREPLIRRQNTCSWCGWKDYQGYDQANQNCGVDTITKNDMVFAVGPTEQEKPILSCHGSKIKEENKSNGCLNASRGRSW
jgi:hypothetical protein